MTPRKLLLCGILMALSGSAQAQQLISNGSFEAQPVGTQSAAPGGASIVDSTTFSNFRVYNVGSANGFTAAIISNASVGNAAMRLDLNNTNNGPQAYALDRDNAKVPASLGTTYNFLFDAAFIGGSSHTLALGIAEYDANNVFTGNQTAYTFSLTDTNYQTFSVLNYMPVNAATTQVNIIFSPVAPGGVEALSLDNVRFGPAPEPGVMALVCAGGLGLFGISRRFKRVS